MKQSEAPVGTVATLGHPLNNILIIRINDFGVERWVYYDNHIEIVDDEAFRAGWDIAPQPEPFEPGHGRPDLDMLHQVVQRLDQGVAPSYLRQLLVDYLRARPDDRP